GGGRGLVAGGTGRCSGHVSAAVGQRRGRDRIIAAAGGDAGAEHGGAVGVVDRHGAAGLGGAGDGQRGVVGAGAVGQVAGDRRNIVVHRADGRRVWLNGVLDHREAVGGRALVAGGFGRGGGQRMAAVGFPTGRASVLAAAGGDAGAEHGGAVGVVDRHGAAGLGGAGDGQRGVVGAGAVGQVAGDRRNIVVHRA